MFLNRFETTPTNRNRHRARVVFDLFLATDILAIGDRPLDPIASARFANPTREDPSCNACHKIIDPVAGAFQKFDDYDQERYRPDREWHAEMFPPGYGSDEMTIDEYPFALNWLGDRIAKDPRFVRATVQLVFSALTGQEPLAYPADPEASNFASEVRAWEAQDQFFRAAGLAFVGSDSSYNLKNVFKTNGDGDGAGKDHWPVTSVLAMGPGIPGNRVIGGTTPDQRARLVDPASLAVVDGTDGVDGVRIRPEHIHHSLRRLAGLDDVEFPLPGESLPLFG